MHQVDLLKLNKKDPHPLLLPLLFLLPLSFLFLLHLSFLFLLLLSLLPLPVLLFLLVLVYYQLNYDQRPKKIGILFSRTCGLLMTMCWYLVGSYNHSLDALTQLEFVCRTRTTDTTLPVVTDNTNSLVLDLNVV